MKKIVSCIVFVLVILALIARVNDILIPKATNRYYILEDALSEMDDEYDVQIYGSCHSYTSFNPMYLEENYDISAFVLGNAGEIIPTTYVRMKEQFEVYAPQVALVEIWGINPYETYDTTENILGGYLTSNVERLPLSAEKLEVINEYDTLDMLEMNFAISRYKDRLMDFSITDIDFNYSFEATNLYSSEYVFSEMTSRLNNRGFKVNPSEAIEDYPDYQAYIEEGESLEIEPDIMKYLEKIVVLCEEYDVELIFYRSPYISTENELRKLNYLRDFCNEHEVLFIDLEEDIQFDYTTDFIDYQHLSETGAMKATIYLTDYILSAIEK